MMTVTIGPMALKRELPQQSAEMDAATEIVQMAKEQGLALMALKVCWNNSLRR